MKSANKIKIAIDCMGGDHAPHETIKGISFVANDDIEFFLYGDRDRINTELSKYANLKKVSNVIHAKDIIATDMDMRSALRMKSSSSMGMAIQSVKDGGASCAISAGNSGALMALSKIILGTLSAIDRPALSGQMPTKKHNIIMLDLGANTECTTDMLLKFAIMGAILFQSINDCNKIPSIALLNIGSESSKGNNVVKDAYKLISSHKCDQYDFKGFVEPNHIMDGNVDVVVCDGFSGNIALKMAEGTAEFIKDAISQSIKSSIISKIAYMFMKKQVNAAKEKFNPHSRNGAFVLGVNGIVIKSHGSAESTAFANAIKVGIKAARNELHKNIHDQIERLS